MTILQSFWRNIRNESAATQLPTQVSGPSRVMALDLDIAPNDPLLAYLLQTDGPVEVEQLALDSAAVRRLRAAGVALTVPLISQGELVGLINLGPRMSQQAYSVDDRKLVEDLAALAAPALRVAQLVHQQQQEAAERERIAQELRLARIIQQTMLPQELPRLDDWRISAYYSPAREVGGDFYDFIRFDDGPGAGQIGFIVADVTDKGVPAAMVMATTRSILRAAAERLVSPGAVLQRTNEVLYNEIPPRMFVTCFYAVLDPASGVLRYANAGHDVPYRFTRTGWPCSELRARGMPLGLMPGMEYEEKETIVAPGEYILLYSDGLVEAHNARGEMFGFPRLQRLVGEYHDGPSLPDFLLQQLAAFTGPHWEQEDDVMLVTVQREGQAAGLSHTLHIPCAPGNERQAMEEVAALLSDTPLTAAQLARLKTAVAEATMNAMEHGNGYHSETPVKITVDAGEERVRVQIHDKGSGPAGAVQAPDLDAKLAGAQSPRGWGLFLIQNMVDEMNVTQDSDGHTVELIIHLSGGGSEGERNG